MYLQFRIYCRSRALFIIFKTEEEEEEEEEKGSRGGGSEKANGAANLPHPSTHPPIHWERENGQHR